MDKSGLSNLALVLVFLIFFFMILTQRMMLSSNNNKWMNLDFDVITTNLTNKISSVFVNKNSTLPQSNLIMKTKPLRNSVVEQKHENSIVFTDFIHYSPRNGTEISPSKHMAILRCPNQSRCIVPELQLNRKFKVYLCKHPVSYGVRFYYLAREAFLLHPNVILQDEANINQAEFIIYLPGSAPWHKTECSNSSFARKLIVLDEFDGHQNFSPYPTFEEMLLHYPKFKKSKVWYFLYFKRSFVTRKNGTFINFPHLDKVDVYPMTYAIAEAYIKTKFNFLREFDIVCTLRGSQSQLTRLRVQDWVAEYSKLRNVTNYVSGEINSASRTSVNRQYFELMYNARIIVTVNPANWEGDFRLWEALATGSLVLVDPIMVPYGYPLLDGVHVVYYSNHNKWDLWKKLDYYRTHVEEAKKIAIAGYLHTMKFHRTVNLADYILRTAHFKKAQKRKALLPPYTYTGQYLNSAATKQKDQMKDTQMPGVYEPVISS